MLIQFQGLVAFAQFDIPNKPKRAVAVLMNHGSHKAGLSVPTSKVDAAETTHKSTTSANLSCFALQGRVLTSLGAGMPTLQIDDVPRTVLGFPQGKTAKESIIKGAPETTKFNAVFEFPGSGTLTVLDYFGTEGTFDGTNFACIPMSVQFDTGTTDPVTFYVGDLKTTVVVDGSATVAITNLDPNSDGGHYHAYKDLFDETITTITTPSQQNGGKCGKAKGVVIATCATFRNLDVDCSPVRFP